MVLRATGGYSRGDSGPGLRSQLLLGYRQCSGQVFRWALGEAGLNSRGASLAEVNELPLGSDGQHVPYAGPVVVANFTADTFVSHLAAGDQPLVIRIGTRPKKGPHSRHPNSGLFNRS